MRIELYRSPKMLIRFRYVAQRLHRHAGAIVSCREVRQAFGIGGFQCVLNRGRDFG